MNDKMFYGQKVFAIIMMVLFSHLCIFADENVRSHFEYDYQGVVYKVNFNKREAYAWSVSTTNPVTVVKIKSFSLKGSKIKEMTGVSGFNNEYGSTETIDLSATYTFKPVVIGTGFSGSNITSVQMENSVTSIWSTAFKGCSNLKSVTLSSGLTEISVQSFFDCTSLTTIVIPASVETIGKDAFSGSGLKSVSFASGSVLKLIDSDAFAECPQLTSIVLPDQLQKIEPEAFINCTSLQSVVFPSQLTSIGELAFYECSSLKTVVLPSELTNLESSVFSGCSALTSVTINDKLRRINSYTFNGCSSLTEVKFGTNSQLTYIDSEAFSNCASLKTFEMPDKVSSIGELIFDDTPIENLKISAAITKITDQDLYLQNSLRTVTFGNNSKLQRIYAYAFYGYKKLESITFPDNLSMIGESAFEGCISLESIVLPVNLKTLGMSAFDGCSSVKHLEIPESVTSVGKYCFACRDLEDIYVSWKENITTGDANVFQDYYQSYSIYENAVLHVPDGTKNAYKSITPWSSFAHIVEEGEAYGMAIDETNFPDAAFREYVSSAAIDKDQNGRLSDAEIAAVKTINVNNQDIYDLKGIEFFTALTTLNCRFTKMTAIDVSQNTALTDLDCRNNSFTALDVTRNTALVSLKCARNKITSLDVSKNTKLNLLRCNYNQLTALNVSKCTQLQRLDCFGNKIGKTAMGNLIASLPTTTNGAFYVIDTTLDSEENVCTTDQVAAAKAKGWTVYDYNNNSPVEYAGSTEQELGDLNGDNAVNGTDLVQQTNLILAGQYNAVADMNHDGVVNGTDYVLMVNKILGVSAAPRLLAPASAGDANGKKIIISNN